MTRLYCSMASVELSVFLKVGAQVGLAHGILRIDFGGRLEVRIGFIGFAQQQQRATQIVLRDKVSVGHGHSVRPQIVVGGPVVQLAVSRDREREQNACCRNYARRKPNFRDAAKSEALHAIMTKIPISGM